MAASSRRGPQSCRKCVWGWLAVFLLLDAFLLLVVPGSLLAGRDRELNACMFVLIGIAVLTCAPLLQDNGGTQGSDWAFHLSRIEGIAQGLREGQFPVRIYSMARTATATRRHCSTASCCSTSRRFYACWA